MQERNTIWLMQQIFWTISITKKKLTYLTEVSSKEYFPCIYQIKALGKTFLLHKVSLSRFFHAYFGFMGPVHTVTISLIIVIQLHYDTVIQSLSHTITLSRIPVSQSWLESQSHMDGRSKTSRHVQRTSDIGCYHFWYLLLCYNFCFLLS